MSARVHATEITSEGETMRVRVAAHMLETQVDLDVVVETQNADIALEHAQDELIRAFEEAARELRDRGLHMGER
jgi:hypothetical protein